MNEPERERVETPEDDHNLNLGDRLTCVYVCVRVHVCVLSRRGSDIKMCSGEM